MINLPVGVGIRLVLATLKEEWTYAYWQIYKRYLYSGCGHTPSIGKFKRGIYIAGVGICRVLANLEQVVIQLGGEDVNMILVNHVRRGAFKL